MPRYKLVNGEQIQFTAEEEAQKDAQELEWSNSAFDRALENLRYERNLLLNETDFYANTDVTMSDAMRTYRQQLRDITNGLTTVEEINAVVFPEKPLE